MLYAIYMYDGQGVLLLLAKKAMSCHRETEDRETNMKKYVEIGIQRSMDFQEYSIQKTSVIIVFN